MGLWTATAASLTTVLMRLLPRGAAWSRETDRRANQLLSGLAEEWARFRTRANALVEECDPTTCTEWIGEWERVFGLPEFGYVPTLIADRREALEAKMLSAPGGQSAFYFRNVARRRGFNDALVTGGPWAFTFTVASMGITRARAGTMRAGDRLVEFYPGLSAPHALDAYKPAHAMIWWTDII